MLVGFTLMAILNPTTVLPIRLPGVNTHLLLWHTALILISFHYIRSDTNFIVFTPAGSFCDSNPERLSPATTGFATSPPAFQD